MVLLGLGWGIISGLVIEGIAVGIGYGIYNIFF